MTDTPGRVIGGVDTHKDLHVVAALDELGHLLGTASFPTTRRGYGRLLRWLQAHGTVATVGIEGSGSFGAELGRFLRANDIAVVEVGRPKRQLRRQRGKSDPIDAEAAARAVLSGEAEGPGKTADGTVECIRVLRVARRSAIKARTQASNQLQSIIDAGPEEVRAGLRGLTVAQLVARCAKFRPAAPTSPLTAVRWTAQRLARRCQTLSAEIADLDTQLAVLVRQAAPELLALRGVGVDTAGALLVTAGDNPHRLTRESSFAALCGVSPLEASSGRIVRHRLNRGGDREANAALWRIVLVRLSFDQRTRDYLARRVAEGRTKREAMRCLKRYTARQCYGAIRRATLLQEPTPTG